MSARAGRAGVLRRLPAILAAGLALAVAAPAAAQQGGDAEEERYAMAPASGRALWRLDTRTGELCVFEFTGSQPGGAVLNAGCAAGGGEAGGIKRYALSPRGGGEVWRLDSRSGTVCV
ncbi:MAG: hypothetical protein R3263_08630, partial [Myxococcota bacterium]|nr:hypothetical protein [Myxococcota bacterium]